MSRMERIRDQVRMQIADLYLSGLSMRKIADQFGVTYQSVNKIVGEFGIRHGNPRKTTIPDAEFNRLVDSGMNLREVGEILDCSHALVAKVIARTGHETRGQRVRKNMKSLYSTRPTKKGPTK